VKTWIDTELEVHGLCPGHPVSTDEAATCQHCNISRVTLNKVNAALLALDPKTLQRSIAAVMDGWCFGWSADELGQFAAEMGKTVTASGP
jgi:hypothetical protein